MIILVEMRYDAIYRSFASDIVTESERVRGARQRS